MSGDVFSSGKPKDGDRVVYGRINLNDHINKNSCGYSGSCLHERTSEAVNLCYHCIHQSKFDIPRLINEKLEKLR